MKMKIIILATLFVAVSDTASFAQETVSALTIDSTLSVGDSATFGSESTGTRC